MQSQVVTSVKYKYKILQALNITKCNLLIMAPNAYASGALNKNSV